MTTTATTGTLQPAEAGPPALTFSIAGPFGLRPAQNKHLDDARAADTVLPTRNGRVLRAKVVDENAVRAAAGITLVIGAVTFSLALFEARYEGGDVPKAVEGWVEPATAQDGDRQHRLQGRGRHHAERAGKADVAAQVDGQGTQGDAGPGPHPEQPQAGHGHAARRPHGRHDRVEAPEGQAQAGGGIVGDGQDEDLGRERERPQPTPENHHVPAPLLPFG